MDEIQALKQQIEQLREEIKTTYVTKVYVQMYVEQILGDIMPVHDPITENTDIVGYVPLDIERTLKHFQNISSTYTLGDYRKILRYYDEAAKQGNINPYIAVAQWVKEADWNRSWWSQRPRRNPAGLGVTGETSTKTQDKNSWAFDSRTHEWKKGYSFPSWQVAAQAHVGHILAYAFKDNELTPEQRQLVDTDPRASAIKSNVRGTVKKLKDFDGKWASPGVGYGKSISVLANALRK